MKSYDEMFKAAVRNYGDVIADRVAAATVLIKTKDGLARVTAVVDLDYQPRPGGAPGARGDYLAVRCRTEFGATFRTYLVRGVDFTAWTEHTRSGTYEHRINPDSPAAEAVRHWGCFNGCLDEDYLDLPDWEAEAAFEWIAKTEGKKVIA